MSLSSLSTSRPVTVLMFYIGVVVFGIIAFDLHMREDVLSRWFKQRTQMTMEEFRRKNGKTQTQRGGGKPKRR